MNKGKNKAIDWGQVAGATIFIVIFLGLVFLGIFYEADNPFDGSFFDDVGKVMSVP